MTLLTVIITCKRGHKKAAHTSLHTKDCVAKSLLTAEKSCFVQSLDSNRDISVLSSFVFCLLYSSEISTCSNCWIKNIGTHALRYERKEADLLKSLNEAEIEKEEETSTLFRAASLTTTLMDLYMKSVCTGFLHSAIQDTILKLLESKQSCEVICCFYRF